MGKSVTQVAKNAIMVNQRYFTSSSNAFVDRISVKNASDFSAAATADVDDCSSCVSSFLSLIISFITTDGR